MPAYFTSVIIYSNHHKAPDEGVSTEYLLLVPHENMLWVFIENASAKHFQWVPKHAIVEK